MQPYVDNSKPLPPHIRFVARPVEDRDASIAADRPIYRDENVVIVNQKGSINTVEKPAEQWLKEQREKAQKRMIPYDWPDMFQKIYDNWRQGVQTDGVDGTPLRHWNGITQSQLQNCHNFSVFTVEDLAGMNDEGLRNIGFGGQALKQRAQAFLDMQKGGTGEELAALRAENVDQKQTIARQNEKIERLMARLEAIEAKVS